MLDSERQYFMDNRDELLQRYPGKFVVVKDQRLLGAFDTIQDALSAGAREYGMSSFLVRRTDEQPDEVSIPALTLGILRANPPHPVPGTGANS
jgi:hypothetical protein